MSNSDSQLPKIFSSSQQGKEKAVTTMREMEALALIQVMEREKRQHSSSFGGSKLVTPKKRVWLTPYEKQLLSDFEEKLRPKFDLEAFLEECKARTKVQSSVGGCIRDQEGILQERLPPRKEYSSIAELKKSLLTPPPRFEEYAVRLALDKAKWERSGLSNSDFVKEEALKFLKDTFGSSGAQKFCYVYHEVENAFFCFLYEVELKAILEKDEVVQVRLVDEIMLLRLSGISPYYTMMKEGCFMPEKLTVFDL